VFAKRPQLDNTDGLTQVPAVGGVSSAGGSKIVAPLVHTIVAPQLGPVNKVANLSGRS